MNTGPNVCYYAFDFLCVFDSADDLPSDPLQSCYNSWLSLVDHLNIKAFVNLTLAASVRHGVQNLLFITGFGRQISLMLIHSIIELIL